MLNMKFPILKNIELFKNIEYINPLKQELVSRIVKEAHNDAYVKRILIFGSSTRDDCRPDSDIDICIDWTEDCYDHEAGILKAFTRNMWKKISHITEGNVDIVEYDYLKGTVIEEAARNGVVVYII